MRALLQQNPSILNAILQQIGQSNPQLLQLISQNQEAFIRMINEPEGAGGESAGGGGGGTGGGPAGINEPGVIQVSPEDKEAIERVRKSIAAYNDSLEKTPLGGLYCIPPIC